MMVLNPDALWKTALLLAGMTVFYNLGEGIISVIFGISDKTLSLSGFGLDSFVEVISGFGIWQMVINIRKQGALKGSFEKGALKITGVSFYLLATGLVVAAFLAIYNNNRPTTTVWGIIISLVSIATMLFLMTAKLRIGQKLNSAAIIADANCTRTCVYLSLVLLVSSVVYEVFRIGYVDSIGALGIAWYAFIEGKESIEKSKGNKCACGSDHQGNQPDGNT